VARPWSHSRGRRPPRDVPSGCHMMWDPASAGLGAADVRTIFTVGHSTRTLDALVALLARNGVTQLADVRTVPKSRRHPQFVREALAESLPRAGVTYRHFAGLGGLRKPRPDSANTAWRNESFRGYADYMQTPPFALALDELIAWAGPPTAIMCAEAVWWQCHRQLIAAALVARGVEVRHVVSTAAPELHKLTEFARVEGTRVTYPGLI
jgi:uncharacterized protein (DUF488 family)